MQNLCRDPLVRIAHPGLLARSDRLILEIAAKLVIRMRTTDAKTSELNALLNVLAKLGMTPASRLKMNLLPLDLPTQNPPKNMIPGQSLTLLTKEFGLICPRF
jgi:hypothetical protein